MTTNLRDHLLSSLGSIPGTREFHLHALVSTPRKNSSLYIFAKPLPRILLQDVLVLCSEQPSEDAPRVLVTAIEAFLYYIPSTSSHVLYIAKVDTTGQGIHPSPTVALVRSLITFYANPLTRPIHSKHLWIHLFARAQGQYLFPNSSEFTPKRPLTDVKLCVWWKRVLTDVVEEIQTHVQTLRPYYLLPGYNEFEALNALNVGTDHQNVVAWIYGQPYTQTEIPLPCPRGSNEYNLGYFIPSFEDDPKSRFLDDIAYNTNGDIKSPAKKRPRKDPQEEKSKEKNDKGGKDDQPLGELGKVAADEFWERMSFRQECVSGAVTGFFAVGLKYLGDKGTTESAPVASGAGQVSSQVIKRVLALLTTGVEFSTKERSSRATETVENCIKRLCEVIGTVPTNIIAAETERQTPEKEIAPLLVPSTPPRRPTLKNKDMDDESLNEGDISSETYEKYIYGSKKICNEKGKEKKRDDAGTEQVTVLTVRRRKRK